MSQKTSDPVYLACRNRGKVDNRHRLGGVHSAEYRALEGMRCCCGARAYQLVF